jgi:signal peptidase I
MVQSQLNLPLSAGSKPKLKEIGLWLLRQRFRLRVVGLSMLPTLYPGDEVLVDRQAYAASIPAVGDLVVAEHPSRPGLRMVKRVVAVTVSKANPQGRTGTFGSFSTCTLLGDNADASTDSRSFGDVPAQKILGKVTGLFYRAPQ